MDGWIVEFQQSFKRVVYVNDINVINHFYLHGPRSLLTKEAGGMVRVRRVAAPAENIYQEDEGTVRAEY